MAADDIVWGDQNQFISNKLILSGVEIADDVHQLWRIDCWAGFWVSPSPYWSPMPQNPSQTR